SVPCAEAIINDASSFKSQMVSTGLSGKPIFNTEGSWGSSNYDVLTSAQQVAFIARWYLLHWSSGIGRMMWYAADNTVWGTLCATQMPCVLTPAGVAYNQIYSWMVGATMSTPCTANGKVWTCGLLTAGIQALAVWNTAGSSSYTVPSGYGRY